MRIIVRCAQAQMTVVSDSVLPFQNPHKKAYAQSISSSLPNAFPKTFDRSNEKENPVQRQHTTHRTSLCHHLLVTRDGMSTIFVFVVTPSEITYVTHHLTTPHSRRITLLEKPFSSLSTNVSFVSLLLSPKSALLHASHCFTAMLSSKQNATLLIVL